eukprot:3715829-Rhodomonas_salina.1
MRGARSLREKQRRRRVWRGGRGGSSRSRPRSRGWCRWGGAAPCTCTSAPGSAGACAPPASTSGGTLHQHTHTRSRHRRACLTGWHREEGRRPSQKCVWPKQKKLATCTHPHPAALSIPHACHPASRERAEQGGAHLAAEAALELHKLRPDHTTH